MRRYSNAHDDAQMVAHNRPGMNTAGENVSQLQNAGFNPGFSVLEAFSEVFVQATQPRTAHTTIHAIHYERAGETV